MIDSTALLRSAMVPVTLLAEASSRLSSPSREAMVLDSRLSPSRAALTSGGLSLNSVASVVERLRELVGVDPLGGRGQVGEGVDDVVGRHGPVERDLGVLLELSGPPGSRARYLAPSRVFIRMLAPVAVPKAAGSVTLKSTITRLPARSTLSTLPTFTPAMRTSSPLIRPPASLNAAL